MYAFQSDPKWVSNHINIEQNAKSQSETCTFFFLMNGKFMLLALNMLRVYNCLMFV